MALNASSEGTTTVANIAPVRRAIEAEGIRLLFDETGAAAGIARQDAQIDLSSTG
jgi:hypothetical protein